MHGGHVVERGADVGLAAPGQRVFADEAHDGGLHDVCVAPSEHLPQAGHEVVFASQGVHALEVAARSSDGRGDGRGDGRRGADRIREVADADRRDAQVLLRDELQAGGFQHVDVAPQLRIGFEALASEAALDALRVGQRVAAVDAAPDHAADRLEHVDRRRRRALQRAHEREGVPLVPRVHVAQRGATVVLHADEVDAVADEGQLVHAAAVLERTARHAHLPVREDGDDRILPEAQAQRYRRADVVGDVVGRHLSTLLLHPPPLGLQGAHAAHQPIVDLLPGIRQAGQVGWHVQTASVAPPDAGPGAEAHLSGAFRQRLVAAHHGGERGGQLVAACEVDQDAPQAPCRHQAVHDGVRGEGADAFLRSVGRGPLGARGGPDPCRGDPGLAHEHVGVRLDEGAVVQPLERQLGTRHVARLLARERVADREDGVCAVRGIGSGGHVVRDSGEKRSRVHCCDTARSADL